MTTLTYNPAKSDFESGGVAQTPAVGDTVLFTSNGGVSYAYTIEPGFNVTEIDASSDDAMITVPGGESLSTGGGIFIGMASGNASNAATFVLGAAGGAVTDTTVINTNSFSMVSGGHLIVNDTATVISNAFDFTAAPGTPTSQYSVSIANGASLLLTPGSGTATALDFPNFGAKFIELNDSGFFTTAGFYDTAALFLNADSALAGSGMFTDLDTIGGGGQVFDTNQVTYPVTLGSQLVTVGTIATLVHCTLTGAVTAGGANVSYQGALLNGVTLSGNLTLTTGQSVEVVNDLFGNAAGKATVTGAGGVITSDGDNLFDTMMFVMLGVEPTPGHAVPAAVPQNLFSAEFENTTFGPHAPITITGATEFDATGGGITLENQTEVTNASAQFNGQLSLAAGGLLFEQDVASVTLQSDIVNNGAILLAGGSSLTFEGSSLTQPGTIRFLGAGSGVNFQVPGVDPPTLVDFGDSDSIDIGSTFGGDSDFGPHSTAELSGSLLDVLNNAGSVIAAFTLQRTDGFTYQQSDFSVNTDSNGGTLVFTNGVPDVACFAAGTHILTAAGEVPVELLREGDLLPVQVRRGLRPIVWIGHRRVDCRRHPKPEKVWPVRVTAHAFAPGRPHRALWLSPDHTVLVADVLIPIRHLINGDSIAQVPMDEVTYYHVELPRHEVLLADGLPCESYLDTGNRGAFANAGVIGVHADFASQIREAEACARLVVTGAELLAARRALCERVPQQPDLRSRGLRAALAQDMLC